MKAYILIFGLFALTACDRGAPPEPATTSTTPDSYGAYYYDCYEYVNGKPSPIPCPKQLESVRPIEPK